MIFTLDYEIYGNGNGLLEDLVIRPAEKLKAIFDKWHAPFVVFADVAELELMEAHRTDPSIDRVKQQLRDFHRAGFELGLHIHPWWYKARREGGRWIMDQSEYNLSTQPDERIGQILDRAIAHLRGILGIGDFTPVSFRAGHLLFQPTRPLGKALAGRGIIADSSIYPGGLWRQQGLDYRRAPRRQGYWRFMDDVTMPDPEGELIEFPIYTQMAPIWKLFTSKRLGLQQKGGPAAQTRRKIWNRIPDILRLRYPLKFDLGQMTRKEMIAMADRIVQEDRKKRTEFRPVVAIAHTKDPIEFEAVDDLLAGLRRQGVGISTFGAACGKIPPAVAKTART